MSDVNARLRCLCLFLALVAALSPALLTATSAGAEQAAPGALPVDRIPERGVAAEDFQPPGWVVETSWKHEMNNDGLTDLVLLLVQDLPATVFDLPNERLRGLLVLMNTGEGDYRLVGAGAYLLYCSTCYGMLAGPEGGFPDISFHDNVLIVNQVSGSREMFDLTFRFRYAPGSDRMVLIGRDARLTDRLTAASVEESTNMITGRHVVTRSRINPATEEEEVVKEESRRTPSAIPMEDVDAGAMSMTPTLEDLEW